MNSMHFVDFDYLHFIDLVSFFFNLIVIIYDLSCQFCRFLQLQIPISFSKLLILSISYVLPILSVLQGDRGAILTTHSMEEADALCSRVGIMVKGELRYEIEFQSARQNFPFSLFFPPCRCLGSTQHLKNKYGGGYVLDIKSRRDTTEEDWNKIHNEVRLIFYNQSFGHFRFILGSFHFSGTFQLHFRPTQIYFL